MESKIKFLVSNCFIALFVGLIAACGSSLKPGAKAPDAVSNDYVNENIPNALPTVVPSPVPSEWPSPTPSASPLPSESPSPTPTVIPPPPANPDAVAPEILLIRLAPVTSLGALAPVEFRSIGGTVTSLSVNGLPVIPNTQVLFSPVAPGSPRYLFDIFATGPAGLFRRTLEFYIPTCIISGSNISLDNSTIPPQVNLTARIQFPLGVSKYSVNGVSVASYPLQIGDYSKSLKVPYDANGIQLVGLVENAVGDASQCVANVMPPVLEDPTLSFANSSTYYFTPGYRASQDRRSVLVSIGAGYTTGYLTQGTSRFNISLIDGSTSYSSRYCGSNQVVVGFQGTTVPTSVFRPICQSINANFELYGEDTRTGAWGYGATLSCGYQEVMTASGYNQSTNTFMISCAKVRWRD